MAAMTGELRAGPVRAPRPPLSLRLAQLGLYLLAAGVGACGAILGVLSLLLGLLSLPSTDAAVGVVVGVVLIAAGFAGCVLVAWLAHELGMLSRAAWTCSLLLGVVLAVAWFVIVDQLLGSSSHRNATLALGEVPLLVAILLLLAPPSWSAVFAQRRPRW